MRSSHSLESLDTAFDDDRLVADAGLLLPATLANHLGLRELVNEHLDLGRAAGAANAGDKLLTLVMSALAGGDCIDDANALRAGGTERVRPANRHTVPCRRESLRERSGGPSWEGSTLRAGPSPATRERRSARGCVCDLKIYRLFRDLCARVPRVAAEPSPPPSVAGAPPPSGGRAR